MVKKGNRKIIRAWTFYDWANSAYTLTITSTLFPIFYGALFLGGENGVSFLGFTLKNTALISFITAFTFLLISVFSPILSGIADYLGNKKSFLQFFCYTGAVGCIGLNWFSLEMIHLSMFFYFLGLLGYWGSLVFYNAYLPDIADKKEHDRISAYGFSMGYIGSVILLLVNLFMVLWPDFFGISGTPNEASVKAMRYSFITVGLWWIVFSQYTFYYLPSLKTGKKLKKDVIAKGLKELYAVWQDLKHNPRLRAYLQAFFVSSMAVQTIMLVAAYFGEQEIAWGKGSAKTIGLITSILIIQLIAIFGSWLSARASAAFGNIRTLIAINGIWLLLCVIAYFVYLPIQFYIIAGFVGLVMGGVQSLSRSTYAKFLPKTQDTTSYFSFYDVAEKVGIVIGY